MNDAQWAEFKAKTFARENDAAVEARYPWRQMSPEEWVARHGHRVLVFSDDLDCYRNAELGRWIQRLGELLALESRGRGAIDVYRRQYLSPAEYQRVQEEIANWQP